MDIEKITVRTRITIRILLWIAERLYDGVWTHQIKELATSIKEDLKKLSNSE